MLTSYFRLPFRHVLVCVAATLFIVGCSVSNTYMQTESAQQSEYFRHQHLIGKKFVTSVPISVHKLLPGMANSMEQHGIPLGIKVAGKDKFMRVAYEHHPFVTLPAATVIEMVGEMVFRPGTAMVSPSNHDYFIVHDISQAFDLLLPFPSALVEIGIRGQTPRAHVITDHPEPFLFEVDVLSQWTCARYDMIEDAQWYKNPKYKISSLNISRRLTPPTC